MENSSIKKRAEKIDQWIAVDVVPIFVYPLFTAVFMALKPKQQLWLSLLLPIIKRLLRRVIWLVLKDDLDIVGATTCTVSHLYHVLFTAMCLQNAKSLDTLGAIVLVNAFQMLLNCRDIMKDADRIQRAKEQLRGSSIFMAGELVSVGLRLAQLDHVSRSLHRKSPSRMFSKYPGYQRVNLMVRYHKLLNLDEVASHNLPPSTTDQDIRLAHKNFHRDNKHRSLLSTKSLSKQTTPPMEQCFAQILSQPDEAVTLMESTTRERNGKHVGEGRAQSERGHHTRQIEAYIHNITSTLHQTEMILLRSYITVFVLLFYGIYLVLVFWLPNKKYYATMTSTESFSDVDSTVFHLILLGSLEVVFMAMYLILISRRLGVSGIHQLAFVLWSQRILIQAKFLTLSLMILGFPLEHYGSRVIFKLRAE
ncbi:hypothetical protein PRIC1_009836 [Phytophthora ramorum]